GGAREAAPWSAGESGQRANRARASVSLSVRLAAGAGPPCPPRPPVVASGHPGPPARGPGGSAGHFGVSVLHVKIGTTGAPGPLIQPRASPLAEETAPPRERRPARPARPACAAGTPRKSG